MEKSSQFFIMDWAKQVLLISAFLVLNEFQFTLGVTCYQCSWMNGKGDKGCQNSPPPSKYLTECSQPQCWKKYAYSKGRTYVQRYCVASVEGKSKCSRTSIDDDWMSETLPATECTCNTDGCNTASTLYFNNVNFTTVTASLVSVVFFSKLLMNSL